MTEAIRPLTVLIIDDEKNIRATLSLCLKQMQCRVTAYPHRHGRARSARAQRTQASCRDAPGQPAPPPGLRGRIDRRRTISLSKT